MLARLIGVELRIAQLIADCDRTIGELTPVSRYVRLARLQDQRRRLMTPDLDLLVAVATTLAEETPVLADPVAAAVKPLLAEHPQFRRFHDRLNTAAAAERSGA